MRATIAYRKRHTVRACFFGLEQIGSYLPKAPHWVQRLLTKTLPEETPAKARVRSVAAAIAILRTLASSRRPLGVNAIARAIKRTPSSCFNILKTLVDEQVVEFDRDTKAYYLGRGMGVIARHALDPNATYTWMRDKIERLADDWSLTVALWRVVHESRLILIGYATGATSVRIHLTIGQRLPLLAGATGQCIAAISNLSDEQIANEFAQLRWDEPPTLAEYRHQIDQARLRSWGLDEGRFQRGVTSVATPIRDGANNIRYCLAATTFAGQLPTARLHDLAEEMLDISTWATRELMPPG